MDTGEPGVLGPHADERKQVREVNHAVVESTEERVRYLAAQVEALQETIARLHGPHNITSGTLPAAGDRRSGRTTAAIILSIGVVICGALLASSLAWRLSSNGTGDARPGCPADSGGHCRRRRASAEAAAPTGRAVNVPATAAPITTPGPLAQDCFDMLDCRGISTPHGRVLFAGPILIMERDRTSTDARPAYTGPGGAHRSRATARRILPSEQDRNGQPGTAFAR